MSHKIHQLTRQEAVAASKAGDVFLPGGVNAVFPAAFNNQYFSITKLDFHEELGSSFLKRSSGIRVNKRSGINHFKTLEEAKSTLKNAEEDGYKVLLLGCTEESDLTFIRLANSGYWDRERNTFVFTSPLAEEIYFRAKALAYWQVDTFKDSITGILPYNPPQTSFPFGYSLLEPSVEGVRTPILLCSSSPPADRHHEYVSLTGAPLDKAATELPRATKEAEREFLELFWRCYGDNQPSCQHRFIKPKTALTNVKKVSRSLVHQVDQPEFVLSARLSSGNANNLIAEHSTGKSLLALTTALAVATGQPLTGETVHTPGPVMVINNEDPENVVLSRLAAASKLFDIDLDDVDIHLRCAADSNFRIAERVGGEVLATAECQELAFLGKQLGLKLIIIDPLITTHSLEENDAGDQREVYSVIRWLANEVGCAIEIVDHKGKQRSRSDKGSSNSARGSVAKGDSARSSYELNRINADTARKLGISDRDRFKFVRLDCTDHNNASRIQEPIFLEIVPVSVGDTEFPVMRLYQRGENQKQSLSQDSSPKLEQLKEVLEIIGDQPRVAYSDISAELARRWGVKETSCREKINSLIPMSEDQALEFEVSGNTILLWRSQQYDRAPIFINRTSHGSQESRTMAF